MLRKTGLILILAFAAAAPAAAQDDTLSVYKEPQMPDPVADNGVHFAPGLATAGTATAGAPLMSLAPGANCKPSDSCALPPPALASLSQRR